MKKAFVLCLILLSVLSPSVFADTAKPFVIPELKEWKGKDGYFELTNKSKIVIAKDDEKLRHVANEFSKDFKTMFGVDLSVTVGKASEGDFVFALKKDNKLGKEGYQVKIDKTVSVSAPEAIGLYWATRTLLQMTEQDTQKKLPKGEIRDFPDFAVRGFMLDCGRKFIPIDFLEDYVKMMAYYKMNTFHIHLNDNGFKRFWNEDWDKTYSAFRLESDTYPGLASEDGYYTKEEFKDLQKLAESKYLTIIPEIDVPAHSLAFAHYLPEIGSKEYGMDHLDLFNPKTYEFLDGLFEEYLGGDDPVFRGELVHVGTDEYSNAKKEVVEKFRYFTDYCIGLAEKHGKKAAVWGALTHAKGDTPVKIDDVLMYIWHNNYSQPDDMMDLGYDVVSIPDGLLYIVPNAGYYYDYLNHKKLYKEWVPTMIGDKTFEYNNPKVKGGMFAVWNDHVDNGISTKDIHHRVLPAMHTLAVKMWTGKATSLPYEDFDIKRLQLSEAPGVNIAGRIGEPNSLVLEKVKLMPRDKMGYEEVGYNYTVSFDIEGTPEEKGTVLFSSPFANFYLADPIKGLLGFSRDGYLNTFKYRIKKGEKTSITICGDNEGTRLYINGKLKENLDKRVIHYKGTEQTKKYISTLVFPLEKAGNFKSKISNLKVYNYLKEGI